MANTRCISAVAISFFFLVIFAGSVNAREVSLIWDPNSESDLAGYKLYYKTGSSGHPYYGTDSLQGASPIDVGMVTAFTLTGLSDHEDYYFVVTAYNIDGFESDYSNEATAPAAVNQPPVADAGPDQTVGEGSSVTLNGLSSSDPDDGIAGYLWQQISGPAVLLASPSAGNTTFTSPDVGIEGAVLTFELTVTDKSGSQSSDQCLVNVTWVNVSPVADAGPEQLVSANQIVILDGSASFNEDDGIGSYLWTQTAGTSVSIKNPFSAQASFVAPNTGAEGNSLTFMLTVTDRNGLKDTDTCIVNVLGSNDPPLADAGPDQTVAEGETVLLDGSGSTDSDDGIVSYQWNQAEGPPVIINNPTAVKADFTAPDVAYDGEILIFQLTVTDRGGLKSSDKCNVSVKKLSVGPGNVYYDLTGQWIGLSRFIKGNGEWIRGDFSVENIGTQRVQSVSVRLYLSSDDVFDATDVLVGNYIVKNIAANENALVRVGLKNKFPGPVFIIAEIDSGNSIPESREDNNIIISWQL